MILLEADPETASLFENRVTEGTVEMTDLEGHGTADGSEDTEGEPQDPPEHTGGERSN